MTTYTAEWRQIQAARATLWAHRADRRGWCAGCYERGTWVRAGECDDYLQARGVIALAESNRQLAPG